MTQQCTATAMCGTMAKRADSQASKGLRPLWTAKRGEPGESFLGVAYFADRKDKGLMLNVCPWCRGEPGYFVRQS